MAVSRVVDNSDSAVEEGKWLLVDTVDVPRIVSRYGQMRKDQRQSIPGRCRWVHSAAAAAVGHTFAAAEESMGRGPEEALGCCATVGSVLPLVDYEPSSPVEP